MKVKGKWVYLYRAVDKTGKTVDFHLSRRRECKRCQGVSVQGDEGAADGNEDHAG